MSGSVNAQRKMAITCVGGVDTETLIPEATNQDEAVIGSDHKALGIDLNALIQEVSNLPSVHASVIS